MTIRVLVLCLLQPRNLEANRRLYSVSDGVVGNVYVCLCNVFPSGHDCKSLCKDACHSCQAWEVGFVSKFPYNAHSLPGAWLNLRFQMISISQVPAGGDERIASSCLLILDLCTSCSAKGCDLRMGGVEQSGGQQGASRNGFVGTVLRNVPVKASSSPCSQR